MRDPLSKLELPVIRIRAFKKWFLVSLKSPYPWTDAYSESETACACALCFVLSAYFQTLSVAVYSQRISDGSAWFGETVRGQFEPECRC